MKYKFVILLWMLSCWAADDSLQELKNKISAIPEIDCIVQKFIEFNVKYPRRYAQAKKPFAEIKVTDQDYIAILNPTKPILAVGKRNAKIKLYNLLKTREKPIHIEMNQEFVPCLKDMIFDASGEHLLFAYQTNNILIEPRVAMYRLDTKKITYIAPFLPGVDKIALSPDNRMLACAYRDTITFGRPNQVEAFARLPLSHHPEYIHFDASGNNLLYRYPGNVGRIVNLVTGFGTERLSDITAQNALFREYFPKNNKLSLHPESRHFHGKSIPVTLNQEYLEHSFKILNEDQWKLINFLVGAEYALHERHAARAVHEGKRYRHTKPMPIDFELFEKYNPALNAQLLTKALVSLQSPFREHIVRHFTIVKKNN